MFPAGQDQGQWSQGAERPWGYVSARVMNLRGGQSLALPDRLTKFVLISGSLRIDRGDAPSETVHGGAGSVDIALPPGARWTLSALSDTVLVLYTLCQSQR